MELVMNIQNIVSHEEKHKILYAIDENTTLYNEYMVKMI